MSTQLHPPAAGAASAILDQNSAWRLILASREADWTKLSSASFGDGAHMLEVARGGSWRSDSIPSAEARELLDLFLPLTAAPGALVIGQLGQSLDGRIATVSGASHYINGEAARTHLHRLRALVDVVLVGVGTLNADDPQLTVRHVPGPQPARAVLDPQGRARRDARFFHDGIAPSLHLVGTARCEQGGTQARRLTLDIPAEGVAPATVIELLARQGLSRVLVEGGGDTVSRFVEAGALDRLHLLVAPMVIGSGRPGITLAPIDTLATALRPPCRRFTCGEDTLFELVLR